MLNLALFNLQIYFLEMYGDQAIFKYGDIF